MVFFCKNIILFIILSSSISLYASDKKGVPRCDNVIILGDYKDQKNMEKFNETIARFSEVFAERLSEEGQGIHKKREELKAELTKDFAEVAFKPKVDGSFLEFQDDFKDPRKIAGYVVNAALEYSKESLSSGLDVSGLIQHYKIEYQDVIAKKLQENLDDMAAYSVLTESEVNNMLMAIDQTDEIETPFPTNLLELAKLKKELPGDLTEMEMAAGSMLETFLSLISVKLVEAMFEHDVE